MKRVVVIDYGSGNLRSVAKALEAVGGSGLAVEVSADPKRLSCASHVVLPGVGAFSDCMNGIKSIDGLLSALNEWVLEKKKPFLGICVGMQLLARTGLEYGEHQGLGWFDAVVKALPRVTDQLKIPHMGWGDLSEISDAHPIVSGIGAAPVYFVHSYYMDVAEKNVVVAKAQHGIAFPAVVARENIVGVQFHPEKSQKAGLQFIKNFVEKM